MVSFATAAESYITCMAATPASKANLRSILSAHVGPALGGMSPAQVAQSQGWAALEAEFAEFSKAA